jgi:VanZ family protein
LLPLRHAKLWLGIGVVLVLGVITGSLVPARMIEAIDVSDKLEHSGSYLLLMAWFGGLYRRGLQPWVGLGLVVLGVVLDLLQGLTATRTLDPADMAANTVGVLIGLALSQTFLHGWCQRVERLFS